MKIQVCSDLHLERAEFDMKNWGADVLVLSGDIVGAKFLEDRDRYAESDSVLFNRFRKFFDDVSDRFNNVVYVSGNHEFYGCKWKKTHTILENFLKDYANVHYLERDFVDISGVRFIGGTLWTDLNKGDPMTLHAVRGMMNDYKHIVNEDLGFTKLRPITTAQLHRATREYFNLLVKDVEKVVICSHHAPCRLSVSEYYKDDFLMNVAYFSELSEFILDRPQIALWTHGHMHDPKLYKVGDTTVACNPRGYIGYEQHARQYSGAECIVEI